MKMWKCDVLNWPPHTSLPPNSAPSPPCPVLIRNLAFKMVEENVLITHSPERPCSSVLTPGSGVQRPHVSGVWAPETTGTASSQHPVPFLPYRWLRPGDKRALTILWIKNFQILKLFSKFKTEKKNGGGRIFFKYLVNCDSLKLVN